MQDRCPRRILVLLALGFGAGILPGLRLAFYGWFLAALAICLLTAIALRCYRLPALMAGIAAMFFAGLSLCAWQAHPALPEAGSYAVTGRVDGEARFRAEDNRVTVYLRDVHLNGERIGLRAYWTYYPEDPEAPLPQDGQTAAFTARLYHPQGQVNPHGFDFRLYLLQRGTAVGLSGAKELTMEPAGQTQPDSLILRVRRALLGRLRTLLNGEDALAAALLLSERADMPEDMTRDFQRAGVAHVLAVSGLHVMILSSMVMLLLRRLSPSPLAMLFLTLALLLPYCLLVGMTASILRASVLLTVLLLGRMARRKVDPLTALAAAFIVVLAVRPLDLFAPGFQMSFAAVAGMILLGDRVRQWTQRIRGKRWRAVVQAYGMTLCASLGVTLPVIYHYHRVSLMGLLINPLLSPLISLLLPAYIVLLLVGAVCPPLGAILGRALAWVSARLTDCIHLAAQPAWASVRVPSPPWYLAAAIVLTLILLTRFVLLRPWRRVLIGVLALAAAVGTMLLTQNRLPRYIQLSLGNADAAIIDDVARTVVIDTGENGRELAAYLLAEGRGIDTLILSHLHTDHAQGLRELLDYEVPIGEICLSTEAQATQVSDACLSVLNAAREHGVPVRLICAGDELKTERVGIRVLWPEGGSANDRGGANDYALALLIDLDGAHILHMSDVSGAYELYAAQEADALKIAHHGSSSSTGEAFLDRVRPAIGLLSARQASAKTLERLAQAGVMIYDTEELGALTLTVRNGEMRVQGYLQ